MPPTTLALPPPSPPGLQEATKNSTVSWQHDLEALFRNAKDRFPDVVWELTGEEDNRSHVLEEVWGHKAIVYARAPPSFQTRYFSFRPNTATSPLPYSSSPTGTYPATSAVSLGLGLDSAISRTPSPYRSSSPALSASPQGTVLRLTTSINPTLFSNELEYLYTGQGFGEAFEFLFDSSNSRDDDGDAETLRIDKLRKDLVFMWRSRLYSDIRIALTGNFSSDPNHENTTAIFSSHRFILVSRSPYFHDALLSWPKHQQLTNPGEPPTLTLPSPPFTPASLHFTLGFIYTGTLIFSHRSYDLSTAFAILRAALYLDLTTLRDEIQARIVNEMLHGLFHAFLPFPEYERLTGGKWGTGGCHCRQCARRAPRVLEFALADDVKNPHLERGSRRALVGLFGEGWCTTEFASLPARIRESLLKGVGKRTTPQNAFPLLFAAEHALGKLGPIIEPWADTVRDMVLTARKVVDELLCRESDACFASEAWMQIVESDGVGFEDGERVEMAMDAVLRGIKEPWAAGLYQTLVSAILLRPHPTEPNAPQLSATSQIRDQVEQARLELLKWIGKRWIGIRQERGFDPLEGWALKEISDHIDVSIEDLLSPVVTTHDNGVSHPKAKPISTLLRPISSHPHTSRVDADSEAASSMRASLLSRNISSRTPTRENGGDQASLASSVRSVARSTVSVRSTASARTVGSVGVSPARKIVNATRSAQARHEASKERPDSKLTPSSSSVAARSRSPTPQSPEPKTDPNIRKISDTSEEPASPLAKKTLVARVSAASVSSRTPGASPSVRPKSSASSIRSHASTIRKSTAATNSLRPPQSLSTTSTSSLSRPGSRTSTQTASSRSAANSRSTASNSSRPVSRVSTRSNATNTSSGGRPSSTVSSTTDGSRTFRTANTGLSTPTTRSRRTSTTSTASVRTANAGSANNSPVMSRARRISSTSVNSVSVGANLKTAPKKTPPVPALDPGKLAPGKMSRQSSARSFKSTTSTSSVGGKKTPEVKPAERDDNSTDHSIDSTPNTVENEMTAEMDTADEEQPPTTASTMTVKPKTAVGALGSSEHKKSGSAASAGSTSTLKRKGSSDTVTETQTSKSSGNVAIPQKLPAAQLQPVSKPSARLGSGVPRGATLEIGIPCIISSKRKRFKAYARYIGEVEGELGPWVGVEVPMPVGENWGADQEGGGGSWEGRQWNDGTWGGIRYFEMGSGESEWDYGDVRGARRRRVDGGSGWGREKGGLKREGEQLSINTSRMKRIRSASPAMSDASGVESRGLFVRPQQVLYVVDAVGEDL